MLLDSRIVELELGLCEKVDSSSSCSRKDLWLLLPLLDSRIVDEKLGLCEKVDSKEACSRWDLGDKNGALQGESRELP